jgi:SulP family sulfate permease
LKLFHAIRARWREGYTSADFRADALAGIVVGMVAIPLGMALAIASGARPEHGLYTVIVGGALVALLGGSRCQVTGPTAAFVVILFPIVQTHGLAGLLVAGAMAGLMLILAGLLGFGKLIQFIPYPVTTGFTAGIAVVIATLQLKDFFGLHVGPMGETYFQKLGALIHAAPTASGAETLIGVLTLAILLLWPKVNRKIPAPLIALSVATFTALFLHKIFPSFEVATIGSRFSFEVNGVLGHGIPQRPPVFAWPWSYPGAHGAPFHMSLEVLQSLLPSAFAIAMLGAIESLLSAVVADGLAHTRHDPDCEITALGFGNLICPFLGGIPATGAIARTATNIRYGARSPLAAVVHAVFTLLVVLLFAPYVAYLPMASLAALLILVAYNMSEIKHAIHVIKVAPVSDASVLMACFSLTVVFDMVVGVTTGVVLAALLFLKRMSTLVSGRELKKMETAQARSLPDGLVLYEIDGPLFFGAAERAMDALAAITTRIEVVVFILDHVPVMDVTGLVALESAVNKHRSHGRISILAGVQTQPNELIARSSDLKASKLVHYAQTTDSAIELGRGLLTSAQAASP